MQQQWMMHSLHRLNPAVTGRLGLVQQRFQEGAPVTAFLTAQMMVLALMG